MREGNIGREVTESKFSTLCRFRITVFTAITFKTSLNLIG